MTERASTKQKRGCVFEAFDRLADDQSALAKLRELIVTLAVQGRLVPQDPKDEPANDLLVRLSRDLPAEKRDRQVAPLPPIPEDDYQYDLPRGWTWARFRDVAIIASNLVKPNDYLDFTHVAPDNIQKGTGVLLPCSTVRDDKVISANHRFFPGQIVYSKIRPALSKVVLVDFEGLCSADMYPIDALVNARFLQRYMLSQSFLVQAVKTDTRVAMPKINQNELNALAVPLPPLAEQKRIVAKVDELMALCDRLEAQLQERDTRQAALARAALARFADAPTPANLELLFHDSFTITPADLRKTILTLAVQGHLVPQDPNDEPADVLLRRIEQKRTEMLKAGYPNRDEANTQIRKQNTQVLPDGLEPRAAGWAWATLIQAGLLVADCHNKTAPYVDSGVRLLRTTNIRNGKLNLDQPKFITPATYKRWSARCKPEPGDILITREAPMGEVCIIPEGMKICLGQRMMMVRLVPGTMDPKFLLYSLMDPALMDRVQDKPVGATVQHLRVGGVETLLTPIPPLAEQRHIVAKVDQLMALVDQWEAQLAAAHTTADNLLSALVAELTAA